MTIYGGEFWFINQQRVKVVNDGVKKKGNPFFGGRCRGRTYHLPDVSRML